MTAVTVYAGYLHKTQEMALIKDTANLTLWRLREMHDCPYSQVIYCLFK